MNKTIDLMFQQVIKALHFARISEILSVLGGNVLKDVLPAQGQNSGQHLDGVLVADVEKFVNRILERSQSK